MKKTVFISSTFEDLKEIRKSVWESLKKHNVVIKGMEEFGARRETPLETCLNEVSQSDIFVCIIAFRLGALDTHSGKSFTQLEYEKAIDLNKEILIYLMDDKFSQIAPVYVDKGASADALDIFKATLKENHTVDFFKDGSDLSKKLSNRFPKLLTEQTPKEQGNETIYKDILQKFIVMPKVYTGREVKCRIEKKSDPFPLSNEVCRNFNLNFGETAGFQIKIIDPEIKDNPVDLLVVEHALYDEFIEKYSKDNHYDLELLFSKNSVENVSTFFNKKSYSVAIENPDYNPSLPVYDPFSSYATLSFNSNPKYIHKTITEKGEGQVVARLKASSNRNNSNKKQAT